MQKFQMAPILKFAPSLWSKKKEHRYAYQKKNPSKSPVRSPPLHVIPSGSLWREMLRHQNQWFIHSFIPVVVPKRSHPTKCRENIQSLSMEAHADGRRTYNGVWPGSPRGSLTTLLSPPQCHAAFSMIPSTLACVDQSPVSHSVS